MISGSAFAAMKGDVYQRHQELFNLPIAMSAPDEDELVIVKLCCECIGKTVNSGGRIGIPVGNMR